MLLIDDFYPPKHCSELILKQVYILFFLYYYGEFLFLVINLTSFRLSKLKKTCL